MQNKQEDLSDLKSYLVSYHYSRNVVHIPKQSIDTKSPDQSVAQQLTTTIAHELIALSLIAEVKSPRNLR